MSTLNVGHSQIMLQEIQENVNNILEHSGVFWFNYHDILCVLCTIKYVLFFMIKNKGKGDTQSIAYIYFEFGYWFLVESYKQDRLDI